MRRRIIHAMAGNPTGAMGVPDYLGWAGTSGPDMSGPGLWTSPHKCPTVLLWRFPRDVMSSALAVPVLLSDISMLVLTGGMERTNAEYATLLTHAGPTPGRVLPVTPPLRRHRGNRRGARV